MMLLNLLAQVPSPVQVPTDGKVVTVAVISTGLFIWSSITNFLQNRELKAANENNKKLLEAVNGTLEIVKHVQTWQKQSWKKIEEVEETVTENHEQSAEIARALETLGHQMEMLGQNQLTATNGLQQVINRMLDILRDATAEANYKEKE